jgi:hypothetical protein
LVGDDKNREEKAGQISGTSQFKNFSMSFNGMVIGKLGTLFQKHNLKILDQYDGYLKIGSGKVFFVISRSERERLNSIYVGRDPKTFIPIDEQVLKDVFGFSKIFENMPSEDFVNNIYDFFERDGELLLSGNMEILKKVENYVQKRSENYLEELLFKQNLVAADEAWKNGRYEEFIGFLEIIDKQKLPNSYMLKYQIASKKLNA